MSVSTLFMFDKALSNSSIFSLKAKFEIAYTAINKKTNGTAVIIEALLLIIKTYIIMNKAERIKKVFLKTLIIDSECVIKLLKLIFEGPKYLVPLIEGIEIKLSSTFFSDPEKLFQVAFSLVNFSTVDFGKQVKFPNLIDFPVKVKVISLCN